MTLLYDEISEFSSPGEYRRFGRWLERQIEARELQELPVAPTVARYHGERWFEDTAQHVWGLAPPDPCFFPGCLSLSDKDDPKRLPQRTGMDFDLSADRNPTLFHPGTWNLRKMNDVVPIKYALHQLIAERGPIGWRALEIVPVHSYETKI